MASTPQPANHCRVPFTGEISAAMIGQQLLLCMHRTVCDLVGARCPSNATYHVRWQVLNFLQRAKPLLCSMPQAQSHHRNGHKERYVSASPQGTCPFPPDYFLHAVQSGLE